MPKQPTEVDRQMAAIPPPDPIILAQREFSAAEAVNNLEGMKSALRKIQTLLDNGTGLDFLKAVMLAPYQYSVYSLERDL